MALNYLTGIGADYYGEELGRKRTKSERKAARKERRKKTGKRVAKLSLAASRAAFLLAVKANALKLADKLVQAYKKDRLKVEQMWAKFGGEPDKLKEAIQKGSKQKLSGVSVGAAGAAFASAVPVIIKFLQVFKELGIISPKEESEFNDEIESGKQTLEADSSIEKDLADLPRDESGRILEVAKAEPGEEFETEEQPFYKKPAFLIGAGVVVIGGIYLATRKKTAAV